MSAFHDLFLKSGQSEVGPVAGAVSVLQVDRWVSGMTQVRSFTDFEAAPETGRSFSVTAGRSTTFPNRRFTAPA